MKFIDNFIGGLSGALALSLLHETMRHLDADAPRIDLIGEEGLSKIMEKAGAGTLEGRSLYVAALAGDILSNSVYYSAIGRAKDKYLVARGALLGLAGGIGALKIAESSSPEAAPGKRATKTRLMTVGYYLAGGLITAFVIKKLRKKG